MIYTDSLATAYRQIPDTFELALRLYEETLEASFRPNGSRHIMDAAWSWGSLQGCCTERGSRTTTQIHVHHTPSNSRGYQRPQVRLRSKFFLGLAHEVAGRLEERIARVLPSIWNLNWLR